MVQPIQGASAPDANYELSSPQNDSGNKGTGNINLTGHSRAYHSTQEHLATATDIGQYKASDPQKYERMKNVYNNTTYEVLEDGSVNFTFKGTVSTADFKEAYGIAPGSMKKYLSSRHSDGVNDGSVYITEARLNVDGKIHTEDFYDDDTPMRYGEGYVTDPQAKMTVAYARDSGRDSYLKYSDGFVSKQVKLFMGGHGPQEQYDGMSLYKDETVTIGSSYLR
ncbi:hypothetical protein J6P92_01895 [bacterium]|nr:hypothetical protein [bacterium]